MTLCPIALVASCKQCPVVRVCLLKGIVGDYQGPPEPQQTKVNEGEEATKNESDI